jgi:hypothetical protein
VAEQGDYKLGAYVADLVKMCELVNFDRVAVAVDPACPRPEGNLGGRPPYPMLVMVRVSRVRHQAFVFSDFLPLASIKSMN